MFGKKSGQASSGMLADHRVVVDELAASGQLEAGIDVDAGVASTEHVLEGREIKAGGEADDRDDDEKLGSARRPPQRELTSEADRADRGEDRDDDRHPSG